MKHYKGVTKERTKSRITLFKTSYQVLRLCLPSPPRLLLDNQKQAQIAGPCPVYMVLCPFLNRVTKQNHKMGS